MCFYPTPIIEEIRHSASLIILSRDDRQYVVDCGALFFILGLRDYLLNSEKKKTTHEYWCLKLKVGGNRANSIVQPEVSAILPV
jgi:hypothetical protein